MQFTMAGRRMLTAIAVAAACAAGTVSVGVGLPGNPHPLLAGHVAALDSAYRELIARLGDDAPASVDAEGRLHVAALIAVPDPPTSTSFRHPGYIRSRICRWG